jgi:hypothetical protein
LLQAAVALPLFREYLREQSLAVSADEQPPDHPLCVQRDTSASVRTKARNLAREAHKYMLAHDHPHAEVAGITQRPLVARPLPLAALEAKARHLRGLAEAAVTAKEAKKKELEILQLQLNHSTEPWTQDMGARLMQTADRMRALVAEMNVRSNASNVAWDAADAAEEAAKNAARRCAEDVGAQSPPHRVIRHSERTYGPT